MNTIDLIIEAYTKVNNGMKRVVLKNTKDVIVKAYAGTIIRIDIKEIDKGEYISDEG